MELRQVRGEQRGVGGETEPQGSEAETEHHIPFLSVFEARWLSFLFNTKLMAVLLGLLFRSVASRVTEMAQGVRMLATNLATLCSILEPRR